MAGEGKVGAYNSFLSLCLVAHQLEINLCYIKNKNEG